MRWVLHIDNVCFIIYHYLPTYFGSFCYHH